MATKKGKKVTIDDRKLMFGFKASASGKPKEAKATKATKTTSKKTAKPKKKSKK